MAEIKSTLDLIMEKTNGMTLSDRERDEIKINEWRGKAQGWVQRYLDRTIDLHTLKREIDKTVGSDAEGVENILMREIFHRIDPFVDNERLFDLLEVVNVSHEGIKTRIHQLRREADVEKKHLEKDLLNRLSTQGIDGSALVPNVETDPRWFSLLERIRTSFTQNLFSLMPSPLEY